MRFLLQFKNVSVYFTAVKFNGNIYVDPFYYKNPDNKTCKTCSNEIYEHDRDDFKEWASRGCKIKAIDDVLIDCEEVLKHQNNYHIRPVYKCPYWNKSDDENSVDFAEKLKVEIMSEEEGTEHYPFFNKPRKEEPKESFPF